MMEEVVSVLERLALGIGIGVMIGAFSIFVAWLFRAGVELFTERLRRPRKPSVHMRLALLENETGTRLLGRVEGAQLRIAEIEAWIAAHDAREQGGE